MKPLTRRDGSVSQLAQALSDIEATIEAAEFGEDRLVVDQIYMIVIEPELKKLVTEALRPAEAEADPIF